MFVKGADSNGADPDNWNQLIAGKVKSHLGHYFNNLGYYNAKIGYLGKISEICQKIVFFLVYIRILIALYMYTHGK